MNNITVSDIAVRIHEYDNILIITHARPDADTLGSAFALKYAYPEKNIHVLCGDEIPERLRFITDGSVTALTDNKYEHIISVDCADTALMGKADIYSGMVEIKIDHHRSRNDYAEYNYADPDAAACAEIIFDILKKNNRLNIRASEALYAAIAADTGCFKYSNTTARTHDIASELISFGIDIAKINELLFERRTKGEIESLKIALQSLEFYLDGRISVIAVSNIIKQNNDISDDDLGSVSSLGREIDGVELAIVIKEKTEQPGCYKVSMRSGESVDCSSICAHFGGGGHLRASGAAICAESLCEAKKIVVDYALECINNV